MKTTAIHKVPKNKYGKVTITNHNLEPHERDTIFRLASFGFDVETIKPSNIPKSHNPDLFMLGTFWEMKGPTTANQNTIKKRFLKAIKQANGKTVFDLNNIKNDDANNAQEIILNLFCNIRGMRRIIIIRDENNALDIFK